MDMADGLESLPVIDPGGREGRALSVSIITDPFTVLESFRRGWYESLEEAERRYALAKQDTDEYCGQNIGQESRMIARQNLAKLALLLHAARTKDVQVAHAMTQESKTVTNHLHLHGERNPRDMTSDERRAYIADLRGRIEAARSGTSGS